MIRGNPKSGQLAVSRLLSSVWGSGVTADVIEHCDDEDDLQGVITFAEQKIRLVVTDHRGCCRIAWRLDSTASSAKTVVWMHGVGTEARRQEWRRLEDAIVVRAAGRGSGGAPPAVPSPVVMLLSDGLCDSSFPAVQEAIQKHESRCKPSDPKILIFTQGYSKRKQRCSWGLRAAELLANIFGVDRERVAVLLFADVHAKDAEDANYATDATDAKDAWDLATFRRDPKELLAGCNIFHMAGGNAWALAQLWGDRPDLAEILRTRVRTGEVMYIGSSGGSIVAGEMLSYCSDARSPEHLSDQGLGIMKKLDVAVYHEKAVPATSEVRLRDAARLRLGKGAGVLFVDGDPQFVQTDAIKPATVQAMLMDIHHYCNNTHNTACCHLTQSPFTGPPLFTNGYHYWGGANSNKYHVQMPAVEQANPTVLFWLPGCGAPDDKKFNALMAPQDGPVAEHILAKMVLVSPLDSSRLSKEQFRLELPEWITELFTACSQHFKGNIVIAGFSRGAKWAHEIVAVACAQAPLAKRALLLAPYCRKAWTRPCRIAHGGKLAASLCKVSAVYSSCDEHCKWIAEGPFLQMIPAAEDVADRYTSHDSIFTAFKAGGLQGQANWLFGC